MDFKRIYNECNLPREGKPPMTFREIYFECNVKPLTEQDLREVDRIGPVSPIGNTQNPPPYSDPKDKQRSPNKRLPQLTPEEEEKIEKIKSDPGGRTFNEILNDQLRNQSQ